MSLVHKRSAKQMNMDELDAYHAASIGKLPSDFLKTKVVQKSPVQLMAEYGLTIDDTGQIIPLERGPIDSVSGQVAKSNKKVEQRLETMRQITKPKEIPKESEISGTWLYNLVDTDTGCTLGIFSDEDKAWAMSEELYALYEIEADVEDIQVDADMYQMATRSRKS